MKKKILILSFEMPPYVVGGIGTVAYEKIKGFKKLGYEIIVIAPKDSRMFQISGVKYEGIALNGNFKKTYQMLKKTIQVCKREKINFIYSLTGTYSGIVAMIVKKLMKIPYFTMAHGNEFIRFQNSNIIKKIINTVYKNSNRIFSVSEFTKNKLIKFGVEERKINVCYNGVDLNEYYSISGVEKENYKKKIGLINDKFNMLTISRLDKRKNHIGIIKAIEKIKEERPILFNKLNYLIGGKGKEYINLENYIKKQNLENKVKLLGFIENTDVNKLYNISNLFVMPNLYIQEDGNVEGFGLVFLEAGATKLTSIGGNVGGSAEAIDDNKNGILVDGNNIEEIKDQIIYLMENKSIVEKLSENAFIKAQQYSWKNIINNINDEIEKSLEDKNE